MFAHTAIFCRPCHSGMSKCQLAFADAALSASRCLIKWAVLDNLIWDNVCPSCLNTHIHQIHSSCMVSNMIQAFQQVCLKECRLLIVLDDVTTAALAALCFGICYFTHGLTSDLTPSVVGLYVAYIHMHDTCSMLQIHHELNAIPEKAMCCSTGSTFHEDC